MSNSLIGILLFIAAVIIYVIAQVSIHIRRSNEQWEQVDKNKLSEWDEDDDWD